MSVVYPHEKKCCSQNSEQMSLAPSPESSCTSSDCEGDKMVHALKRLRIEGGKSVVSSRDSPPNGDEELIHKAPHETDLTRLPSPMVIDDRALLEEARRKQMEAILKEQLHQYKAQYSMITEGPDIAPCG